jgi:hypothetical protein
MISGTRPGPSCNRPCFWDPSTENKREKKKQRSFPDWVDNQFPINLLNKRSLNRSSCLSGPDSYPQSRLVLLNDPENHQAHPDRLREKKQTHKLRIRDGYIPRSLSLTGYIGGRKGV